MSTISEQNLIEKLTQLRGIRPSQNWVILCRKNIVSQIKLNQDENRVIGFMAFLKNFFNPQLIFKPITVIAAVFILISGFSLATISQAQNSLPGDRLYTVKIALEQARLLASTSATSKAEIQNEMIAKRIEELSSVMGGGESMEQKMPRIEEAVNNLQKQLLTVKDELPKVDKTQSKRILAVAKSIDANAVEAGQKLAQAKDVLPNNNLSEKIVEATDEAEKTSNRALEMLVETQLETGSVDFQEILALLDVKIQKTEQKAKELEDSVNNSAIGIKMPINTAIIFDETDKAVDLAKVSLQNNDTKGALEAIKAVSEMIKNAQRLVTAAISESEAADAATTTDGESDSLSGGNKNNASSTIDSATSTKDSILETTPSILLPNENE